MKLHNPLTGVQVSVDDEDGALLLAAGGYAEGETPSGWKRPKSSEHQPAATSASKPAAKSTAKHAGDDTGDAGQ